MGGTGVSVRNASNILLSNPANLGSISKIAFSSLVNFNALRINDGSHHSNSLSASPAQLSFAFPLGKAGAVGIAIGKESETNVKYRSDEQTLPGSEFTGRLSYEQTGGITGWRIGWGIAAGKWALAGAAYERLQFIQNSTKVVDLPFFPANSSRDSSHYQFVAHALHLGVMVPVKKLTIGISGRYSFETELSFSSGQYSALDTSVIPGTDSSGTARVNLPPYVVVGLSYDFSQKLLASADMKITPWNDYYSGGYLPSSDVQYGMGFGAGLRYIHSPDVLAPKYWETINYRAGFQIHQLPRQEASETTISIGAGLPLRSGGMLDLVLSGGQRNDANYSDYEENFARISIGINGGRKWIKIASDY
jgi:hypothetical protein